MSVVTSIKITDNSFKYKKMLEDAANDICDAIGEIAEGYAKEDCPVDTGRLRGSITYATKTHSGFTHVYEDNEKNVFSDQIGKMDETGSVYIGSNVEYAEENENHNPNGKSHFLRNAAGNHSAEYKATALARLNV